MQAGRQGDRKALQCQPFDVIQGPWLRAVDRCAEIAVMVLAQMSVAIDICFGSYADVRNYLLCQFGFHICHSSGADHFRPTTIGGVFAQKFIQLAAVLF